ncbi:MAG: cysteine hydrolase family protein [Candidatus Melainabacteria bacterium]|nr:cysteine hydrolase family protein [Candidatus Melainabacteria bacterium]
MYRARTLFDHLSVESVAPRLTESVLIVVDAQREYVDGSLPLYKIDRSLNEIKILLERARKNKTPIFHLVHHAPAGAPIFDPNGEFVEIAEQARPVDGEPVVIKNLPGGFVNTNLHELITGTKRKNVIIAGFMTHMCIDATTRGAADLGYNATVVAATCTTRDVPSPSGGVVDATVLHNSSLAALADLVAMVVQDVADIPD